MLMLILLSQNNIAQDSLSVSSEKKKNRKDFIADPQRATMLALTLPGLGQIYNRKYWKVPVVYAGFGGLVYAIGYNSTQHTKYMKAYQDLKDLIPETNSYLDVLSADPKTYDPVLYPNDYNPAYFTHWQEQLLKQIDYHRKYRDLSYIGIALWYMVTVLDANVDASLFNYDISDNLAFTVAPLQIPSPGYGPGVNICMLVKF